MTFGISGVNEVASFWLEAVSLMIICLLVSWAGQADRWMDERMEFGWWANGVTMIIAMPEDFARSDLVVHGIVNCELCSAGKRHSWFTVGRGFV